MLAFFGTLFALAGSDSVRSEERPRAELRRVMALPGMGWLLVAAGCLTVVLQSLVVFAVPSAEDSGLSRFAAGAVFFVLQITAGAARVLWGRIADRGGGSRRGRTLVEACVLGAIGGALFAGSLHLGAAAVIPAAILFAFGALGWNALVYVRAGEMAPPALAAQAVSVAATVVFAVSAAGTAPMGTLADRGGWDAFWLVSAGFAALAALAASRLPAGSDQSGP
jgi:hypothetical protein